MRQPKRKREQKPTEGGHHLPENSNNADVAPDKDALLRTTGNDGDHNDDKSDEESGGQSSEQRERFILDIYLFVLRPELCNHSPWTTTKAFASFSNADESMCFLLDIYEFSPEAHFT